jgi:hypothetical protein
MKSKKCVIVSCVTKMLRENVGSDQMQLRLRQALVRRLTLCVNQRHGHENLLLRQALVRRLTLCVNQRHGHENLLLRPVLVRRLTLSVNQRHGHENLLLRQALVRRLTLCVNQRHGHENLLLRQVLVARLTLCDTYNQDNRMQNLYCQVMWCQISTRTQNDMQDNWKKRVCFIFAVYVPSKVVSMK